MSPASARSIHASMHPPPVVRPSCAPQKTEGCPSCPLGDGQPFRPAPLARLDGLFQFLRGAEGDLLTRLDLDRLAGRGIAAHAGGALANLEDAEAADADAVALFQVLHDEIDHAAI